MSVIILKWNYLSKYFLYSAQERHGNFIITTKSTSVYKLFIALVLIDDEWRPIEYNLISNLTYSLKF